MAAPSRHTRAIESVFALECLHQASRFYGGYERGVVGRIKLKPFTDRPK